jgi:hypothetical protein
LCMNLKVYHLSKSEWGGSKDGFVATCVLELVYETDSLDSNRQ